MSKEIVEKALDGKLSEMKDHIYAKLYTKVDESIQLKKKEIAQSYFAKK